MIDQLPAHLLRLEGLAAAVGAVALYFDQGFGWLLLVLLILAPDLSALGYLAGSRVGALTYDLAHTYVGPVALAVAGVLAASGTATQLAPSGSRTSARTARSATGSSIRPGSGTRTCSGSDR